LAVVAREAGGEHRCALEVVGEARSGEERPGTGRESVGPGGGERAAIGGPHGKCRSDCRE
ncbi:MAG: hypothetical protein J6O13_13660, partial [Selenomonas sp.]|nr:hypothetical protein [Selenomonas sp.]